ncbi:MAG: zinc-ribbon domain-containing protein [Pseudomonadota bacterium]
MRDVKEMQTVKSFTALVMTICISRQEQCRKRMAKIDMRLTCPNCGAQYEVPSEVVPPSGRDVQCSTCGNTWFQPHPDFPSQPSDPREAGLSAPERQEDEEIVAESPLPARGTPRRELDPAVAEILRQEAALEREARRRRQQGHSIESQPELGLEAVPPPAPPPRDLIAPPPELGQRPAVARKRGDPQLAAEATAAAAAAPKRREFLPDIDELNSTLRAAQAPRLIDSMMRQEVGVTDKALPTSSFRRGFLSVMLVFMLLVLAYIFAPDVADAVPPLKPVMAGYVNIVDQARINLDAWLRSVVGALNQMADTASS